MKSETVTQIEPEVREGLSSLGERFPALRGVPGVRPFDPAILAAEDDRTPPPSLDATIAIRFLLWLCPREHETEAARALGDEFDLMEVALGMTARNLRPLAAWVRSPWVPQVRKAQHLAELDEKILRIQREILCHEGAKIAARALGRDDEDEDD